MQYVLDANVFIEAAKKYYQFDIVPTFWYELLKHAANDQLCSIDKIRSELLKGKDKLADWAKNEFSFAFLTSSTADVQNAYVPLISWVTSSPQFKQFAKDEFADCPDGWLIAYALANNLTVVTHEVYNRDIQKKVPIPNVCMEFGIKHMNTYDMLRELQIRF